MLENGIFGINLNVQLIPLVLDQNASYVRLKRAVNSNEDIFWFSDLTIRYTSLNHDH